MEPTLTLHDDVPIPRLGLGVWQAPRGGVTRRAVGHALSVGYRHVDTARIYGNEADVGAAVRDSGLERDEIFVTTKLWNDDHGYDRALEAADESLARLGLDYVDLFLIHWPVQNLRGESWRALEALHADGRARAIGVSNYMPRHLEELLGSCEVRPSINQIELHPFGAQKDTVALCEAEGILLEAYSPLARAARMNDATLAAVAEAHGKSVAQVMIRWSLQRGWVCIPKSVTPARIEENYDVLDFELTDEDMARIDAVDEDIHIAWNPTDVP